MTKYMMIISVKDLEGKEYRTLQIPIEYTNIFYAVNATHQYVKDMEEENAKKAWSAHGEEQY